MGMNIYLEDQSFNSRRLADAFVLRELSLGIMVLKKEYPFHVNVVSFLIILYF